MARGSQGKEQLINKFIKDNSDLYIGMFDKKYYFWADDNGEKVQIAVSMTCPKVPVKVKDEPSSIGSNREEEFLNNNNNNISNFNSEELIITEEEKNNIEKIMRELELLEK